MLNGTVVPGGSVARPSSPSVVTAVPELTYIFPEGATVSWDFLGLIQLDAPTFVVETGVITFPALIGAAYYYDGNVATGTLTVPEDTSYSIEAAADLGYEFQSGATTAWTFTSPALVEVTPTAPTLDGSEITIPSQTGTVYMIDGNVAPAGIWPWNDVTVVVDAVPASGYKFPVAATIQWTFNPGADIEITPQAPVLNGAYITIPTQTGVTYTIDGNPVSGEYPRTSSAATVNVVASTGYYFATGATVYWSFVGYTPPAPPANAGNDFNHVTYPAATVQWTEPLSDSLEGTTAFYTGIPVAPFPYNENYAIRLATANVIYSIDGTVASSAEYRGPGVYTITAVPNVAASWNFNTGWAKRWTYTLTDVPAPNAGTYNGLPGGSLVVSQKMWIKDAGSAMRVVPTPVISVIDGVNKVTITPTSGVYFYVNGVFVNDTNPVTLTASCQLTTAITGGYYRRLGDAIAWTYTAPA